MLTFVDLSQSQNLRLEYFRELLALARVPISWILSQLALYGDNDPLNSPLGPGANQ